MCVASEDDRPTTLHVPPLVKLKMLSSVLVHGLASPACLYRLPCAPLLLLVPAARRLQG